MANYIVMDKTMVEPKPNTDDTKNKKKSLFKGFNLKKLGGLKSLIMILILLVVAVVMYNFSGFSSTTSTSDGAIGYTTSLEYIDKIEAKLKGVVGGIKGAGKVEVMVSISSSPELLIAENKEEKTVTTSSGTTTVVTSTPIIVDSNGEDSPLVLKETLPSINGVIVVSSGASDVRVKLDIITAVSTVLGISPNIIEVFVGE